MASAVIGALRVNLGIDTAQFNEGLKGVRASLDKVGQTLQKAGTKLTTYVTAPITAAGAAVTAAITTMAKDVEELEKAAQISGAGFEDFQKLAFAARTVGIEGDKLADIFKDVNDRVGDFNATGGGPMADFFENIAPKVGLTAEAFKELSGPQALQLYYDSLVKAGASQQDMTFYLEAMASDATALIPLLRDGGKAFRELGAGATVISESDAAGLQAYNDAMRALGEAIKGLAIALANSGVLEFVTSMASKLTELVRWLGETNPEILKWGTAVAGLAALVGPAAVAIGLMATGLAAVSAPVALAVAGIAALTAGLIAFWPELTRASEVVTAFVSGAWASFVSAWDGVTAKIAAVSAAVVQFANDLVAAFQALPARMMEIGRQIIDGLWQGLKERWEGVKGSVSGFATGIVDSFRSTLGIHSPSRVMHEIGVNIMQGLQGGINSMTAGVQGGVMTVAGGIQGAFSAAEAAGRRAGSTMDDIGQSIGQTFANAFQGLIDGSKKVKDVLKDLLSQLGNMLMNRAFQAIVGNIFGGGGGFGAISLHNLPGFARGGTILPGGAGGIDSQLVAFRKSPNERVDITKPGQTLSTGDQSSGPSVIEIALSPELLGQVLSQAKDQTIKIVSGNNKARHNRYQNGAQHG